MHDFEKVFFPGSGQTEMISLQPEILLQKVKNEKKREHLCGGCSGNCQKRRGLHTLLQHEPVKDPGGKNPQDLFQQLSHRRNPGISSRKVVGNDTDMKCAKGDGECHQLHEWDTVRLCQNVNTKPAAAFEDKKGGENRQDKGDSASCDQQIFGAVFIPCGSFGGNTFGERGLNTHDSKCVGQTEKGKDQLINPKSLCTNCVREEYSIKKADETADETGGGQKKCASEKTLRFGHGGLHVFFKNIFVTDT